MAAKDIETQNFELCSFLCKVIELMFINYWPTGFLFSSSIPNQQFKKCINLILAIESNFFKSRKLILFFASGKSDAEKQRTTSDGMIGGKNKHDQYL